jgi:hypothetical protein
MKFRRQSWPSVANGRTALTVACLTIYSFLNAAWVVHLWAAPAGSVVIDWWMFHDTARLLVTGRVREIYPGVTENLPFFYPPYFALLLAPLGLMSRSRGYLVCVLGMSAAGVAALEMLRRVLRADGRGYFVGVLVVLSSASWNTMFFLGHLSAAYVLLLTAGLFLWVRGRALAAGAVLSLMMLKPNLGLIFVPLLLIRRQWDALAGWLGGFLLLIAVSLPLGSGIWADYFRCLPTASGAVGALIPMWKQQTLYAFWRTALGTPQSPRVVALWLASIAPLLALTAVAWRRTVVDGERLPRLFGLTVLAMVSCNVYLFLYDGLLLAVPGLVWYGHRGTYRSPACHCICGIALTVVYVWQHLSAWVLHGGWALVGPAVAVWLVADSWDLLGHRPRD